MTRSLTLSALFIFAALTGLTAPGCANLVGDACETQTDCGSTMFCERSLPDGYCTRTGCELDGCPDEGVCIVFRPDVSYCMRRCETGGDCRDGYECVKDFGAYPFCNDTRGEPES
jgi:hypothetical protein